MNQSFYFNSNSSLECDPQVPAEGDLDLNQLVQPANGLPSAIHPHLHIPRGHHSISNTPSLNTAFDYYYNPSFYVLTPNDFLSSSANVPPTGNFGGIPPMPAPSLELSGSGNLSPLSSSESGMSASGDAYGYRFNSDLHPADIFGGSLTVNMGASQPGPSAPSSYPVHFIDDSPVTLPEQEPSAMSFTALLQGSSSREGPERVERSTGRKMRSQATPYARPDRRASTPIFPISDVPAPTAKRPKKPSSGRRKHYDYAPDARSTKLAVVCRVNSCSTECDGKEGLMQHLKSIHGIEEEHNNKYRCLSQSTNPCTHVAGGRDALLQHMKSIHNVAITKDAIPDAATERCPWDSCTRVCTQSSLHRHISTHAETTFKCPICSTRAHPKTFSRLTNYRKHFREQHLAELKAGNYQYDEVPMSMKHIE